MSEQPRPIIVICLRVRDIPYPLVPSFRERCIVCSSEVWLDKLAPPEAKCVCAQCSIGRVDGGKIEVLPHTREILRRIGLTDEEIEQMRRSAEMQRQRMAAPFN